MKSDIPTTKDKWNFKTLAKHYQIPLQTLLTKMRGAGIITKTNDPQPAWKHACTTITSNTRWGEKQMRLWDPKKIKPELDKLKIESKPTRSWKPTLRPLRPWDTPNGIEQPFCNHYFLGLGPTRGGTHFENLATLDQGDLLWTDDTSSDIPFFYLKYKAEEDWEIDKINKEIQFQEHCIKNEEQFAIDPKGTGIETLIVPIKHDGAIYIKGNWPKGKALKKLKELCDQHNIWMALTFGNNCSLIPLPWKKQPKKP